MSNRPFPLLRFTALAAALALAACGRGEEGNLANLDNQLVGNNVDPALTSALEDQILVDPSLAQQSNKNAVRPPETPTQAQYPVGGSGGAGGQQAQPAALARGEGAACQNAAQFDYNLAWARRLSPAFAVYPGAQVTDAAGNNQGDCRSRVVTFTTREPAQKVLDWYRAAALRAGYSAEQQRREGDHILAGTQDRDGGAYYLIVTPRGGGSDVALIANNGR